ncbi:unnamed protein product [Symbiodinium necroappetens]|uniref:Uncharacterized protein n=1 Tax=Symbiodinium necroappetens TaxID=1628268 RepID=A0A813A0C7_9DINO|nr:unnamed protein product [Symbiodinium necroappetens]
MMLSAPSGMLVAERAGAGFTLHRSETVAHSAGLLDRKNFAASSRARGRSEGFACKHSDGYKPLGAPVPSERVVEMHNSTFAKVDKIKQTVGREASSQHQNKKDKERTRRKEQELERLILLDSQDVIKDEQTVAEEVGLEADRKGTQNLSRLPHALYGKDLPRCGQAQERQEKDGFKELKLHIRSSYRRVEQVRADSDAAYEARSDNLQLALTSSRQGEAPVEDGGSAFLTSLELPLSARDHRPVKPQQPQPLSARRAQGQIQLPKVSPKRVTNWLPSLSEYLASNGTGVSATAGVDRAEPAEGIRYNEELTNKIVSELLPLPEGTRSLLDRLLEEQRKAGTGKGRMVPTSTQRRKKFQEELVAAWKPETLERCNPCVPSKVAEEMRQRYHGDEFQLATVERILKDLVVNEEQKGPPGAEMERASSNPVDGSVMSGPAGANKGPTSPTQDAVLQDKRRAGVDHDDELNKGLQRLNDPRVPEPAKPVAAHTRARVIQQKALSQLREPDQRQRSPLVGLRWKVIKYQESRDTERKKLQAILESQAESRMAFFEDPTRKLLMPGWPVEGNDGQQHQWYRSLLEQIRTQLETADASKAMYVLLDSVKSVLDEGAEFEADDFWQCVSDLQADDVTVAMASLLGSVIRGVRGLSGPSVVRALQQQCGDLNPEAAEVLNAQCLVESDASVHEQRALNAISGAKRRRCCYGLAFSAKWSFGRCAAEELEPS